MAQEYNVNGFLTDLPCEYKNLKDITKALPNLSWLQFLPTPMSVPRFRSVKVLPLSNSITHMDSSMGTWKKKKPHIININVVASGLSFAHMPQLLPNLQTLNFSTGVTLATLQQMKDKFNKLKVLRTGIQLQAKQKKSKRPAKRRRTEGENVGQLIEFLRAFKSIAPSLSVRNNIIDI